MSELFEYQWLDEWLFVKGITTRPPVSIVKEGDKVSTEFDKMVKFLDLAWRRKDEIVPCLVGPVGIGKTAAVRQHAKNVGAKNVVTIIASQILPSEVSGITMPDASTKSMEIYDHYKLSSLEDGDILFFDELLEADQCVLSACLTLIESRMLMSGKLLPDIQIIAATNPTVNPANIRENIRQRFMFHQFKIDEDSVADYINEHAGFRPPAIVLDRLESTNNYFNILSPRSLTKLCEWIASATDMEQAGEIASYINGMFGNTVGTELLNAYINKNSSPDKQARKAMRNVFVDNATDEDMADLIDSLAETNEDDKDNTELLNEFFTETSMDELVDMLSKMDGWNEMCKTLENLEVTEVKTDDDITF